jgi:hypothetical protein
VGLGDIHGRARVDARDPRAFGVCDDCGEWFNKVDLIPQMEWYGNRLMPTGFLVCWQCNDIPQDQLRTVILPPDPIPVEQPRPEFFTFDYALQGFTQYTLVPAILSSPTPIAAGPGTRLIVTGGFNPSAGSSKFLVTGGFATQSAGNTVDAAKAAVLAAIAALSGVATPSPLTDDSGSIAAPFVAQQLVPANASRSFLLIYNPSNAPMAVSLATAAFGAAGTINIGPGNALLMATGATQGAMTIIAYAANVPYFAWEA